jgi:hypothetical protein
LLELALKYVDLIYMCSEVTHDTIILSIHNDNTLKRLVEFAISLHFFLVELRGRQ